MAATAESGAIAGLANARYNYFSVGRCREHRIDVAENIEHRC
jgi:hypothetical protein